MKGDTSQGDIESAETRISRISEQYEAKLKAYNSDKKNVNPLAPSQLNAILHEIGSMTDTAGTLLHDMHKAMKNSETNNFIDKVKETQRQLLQDELINQDIANSDNPDIVKSLINNNKQVSRKSSSKHLNPHHIGTFQVINNGNQLQQSFSQSPILSSQTITQSRPSSPSPSASIILPLSSSASPSPPPILTQQQTGVSGFRRLSAASSTMTSREMDSNVNDVSIKAIVAALQRKLKNTHYLGFDESGPNPLLTPMPAIYILRHVSKKINFTSRLVSGIWMNISCSNLSIAICTDMFWWFFSYYFRPSPNDQQKLFDRMSKNYVNLLLITDNDCRDHIFSHYHQLISRSTYNAFCTSFPSNSELFDNDFKKELSDIVSEWFTGKKTALKKFSNWEKPDEMLQNYRSKCKRVDLFNSNFNSNSNGIIGINGGNSPSNQNQNSNSNSKYYYINDDGIQLNSINNNNIGNTSNLDAMTNHNRKSSLFDNVSHNSSRRGTIDFQITSNNHNNNNNNNNTGNIIIPAVINKRRSSNLVDMMMMMMMPPKSQKSLNMIQEEEEQHRQSLSSSSSSTLIGISPSPKFTQFDLYQTSPLVSRYFELTNLDHRPITVVKSKFVFNIDRDSFVNRRPLTEETSAFISQEKSKQEVEEKEEKDDQVKQQDTINSEQMWQFGKTSLDREDIIMDGPYRVIPDQTRDAKKQHVDDRFTNTNSRVNNDSNLMNSRMMTSREKSRNEKILATKATGLILDKYVNHYCNKFNINNNTHNNNNFKDVGDDDVDYNNINVGENDNDDDSDNEVKWDGSGMPKNEKTNNSKKNYNHTTVTNNQNHKRNHGERSASAMTYRELTSRSLRKDNMRTVNLDQNQMTSYHDMMSMRKNYKEEMKRFQKECNNLLMKKSEVKKMSNALSNYVISSSSPSVTTAGTMTTMPAVTKLTK